ncbi:hypothetical protein ACFW81_24170 [Streptomyces angustmyceticus]|uniref:hypothetical protein n=1 Tax=Streptomyces angustmyceticus TaxID=285578 RepID=UPI0036B74115
MEEQTLDGLTESVQQHIYALFYDQMKLCGCGFPEEAFELVRDLLAVAHERGSSGRVINNGAARHIVLSLMGNVGLLEHGSIIDSAWLTSKGEWYLRQLRKVDDWDALEEFGLPHDGKPCTDRCWLPPIEGIRP